MLVVISGGSQGLGASLARQYVKRGWDVVIVARTITKLSNTVNDLKTYATSKSQKISYVSADVADYNDCTRVFQEIGSIPDAVWCCAGAARPGFFIEMPPETLQENLRTVYDTALYFSHAALKVLCSAPDKLNVRRQLIYCSSTVAVFPLIGYGAYAPAKAAIRALADITRQEMLQHNIRISHVLPGSMATEGFQIEEQTKPEITRKIEGASVPESPDKIARDVLHWLDKGSDTIYTDMISWVLGSAMMGASPRFGLGILQGIVGVFLALFGSIVRLVIDRDIKASFKK